MTKRNTEVPGNTLESQRLFERELMSLGRAILSLERGLELLEDDGILIKAIRCAFRAGPRGDVLLIVTATTDDAGIVAFSSGVDLSAALRTLSNQLRNGSIKWKDDQYANQ